MSDKNVVSEANMVEECLGDLDNLTVGFRPGQLIALTGTPPPPKNLEKHLTSIGLL